MRRAEKLGVIWGAASTGLSACLYLLDLGTTLNTLVTYYYYQYKCPRAAQPLPPLLRHDPICRSIRTDPDLHISSTPFWSCLIALLVAYPSYAVIFWTSLPACQHPLRLAYFMPFIHLYRLFQLFRHGVSFKELQDFQRGQREMTSLYNALGAALETAPQFIIQLVVPLKLGETISGSADPRVQAQRIPITLVLSLVASLVSGFYSSGMAVSLLLGAHVPSRKRKAVAILASCQTLALMLAKAITVAAVAQIFEGKLIPSLSYLICRIVLASMSVGCSYRSHCCKLHGKSLCFKLVHSFVLAIFSQYISPIYVSVKEGKSSFLVILDTFLHTLVDVNVIFIVILRPGHLKERQSPCHALHITESNKEYNKFFTCKVFLGTLISALFVVILTTLIFVWLMPNKNSARFMFNSSYNTHRECESRKKSAINVELRSVHQMSTPTLFVLILIVLTIISVQKLQRKCVN